MSIQVHTHTHSFQCFTESKITRCFFWQALDQDLHITLTQSFKEPICKHECHGVTIFGIVTWEKKDQVLKEGFDPAYGARQGIVTSKLFGLSASKLVMSQKNENSDLSAFQQNDNVNETSLFFLGRIVLLRPLRRAITRMLEAHIRIEINWVVSCRTGDPKDTLAEQLLAQTADDEAALDGSRKKCSKCWFISILWRSFASSHFCHNFRPFEVIHFVGQIPRARRVTLSVWQPRCWCERCDGRWLVIQRWFVLMFIDISHWYLQTIFCVEASISGMKMVKSKQNSKTWRNLHLTRLTTRVHLRDPKIRTKRKPVNQRGLGTVQWTPSRQSRTRDKTEKR